MSALQQEEKKIKQTNKQTKNKNKKQQILHSDRFLKMTKISSWKF